MKTRDNAEPRCEISEGEGCLIPPLGPEEARVMEMRAMVVRLRGLVSPEGVLQMCGATRRQLELLAYLEKTLEEVFHSDDQHEH